MAERRRQRQRRLRCPGHLDQPAQLQPERPRPRLDLRSRRPTPSRSSWPRTRLSASGSVPSQVSATLTFNGSGGTTYYYNEHLESGRRPADRPPGQPPRRRPAGMPTPCRSWTTAPASPRPPTPARPRCSTSRAAPSAPAGRSSGLEQITSASGGVILNLGVGDSTLWFAATAAAAAVAAYTSPAGDFSTLGHLGLRRRLDPHPDRRHRDRPSTRAAMKPPRSTATASIPRSRTMPPTSSPRSRIPTASYTTFTYGASGGALQTIQDPAVAADHVHLLRREPPGRRAGRRLPDDLHLRLLGPADPGQGPALERGLDRLRQCRPRGHDHVAGPGHRGVQRLPGAGLDQQRHVGQPGGATLFAAAVASYTNPNGNTYDRPPRLVRPGHHGRRR